MMKMYSSGRQTTLALVALSVVAVGLAVQARATTMLYVPLEDLYARSDLAVRGTILSHTSFWTDEGQMFTDWTLRVDEALHGEVPELLTFRQMGGEMDDGRRLMVDGDARFADGEHVVVFLVQDDGIYYLTALGQAKLTISLHGDLGDPGEVLELPSPQVGPLQATLVRELDGLVFYQFTEDGGEFYRVDDEILTLDRLRRMSPSFDQSTVQGGER